MPRLPSTRIEADEIRALVPPEQRMIALDFDANLEMMKSPKLRSYRYLHIATHGSLNERPELSKIILSQVDARGRPRNGALLALDVYNLDLPAELVVLSACETARGDKSGGEGVGPLTRGFLYAGAKSVIVSLWKVSDNASAQLMAELYRGMLGERHLSPSAALRAAQLEVRRQSEWKSPFYWAGFVLQGDWK
jgi:CHAT domain-containing protein